MTKMLDEPDFASLIRRDDLCQEIAQGICRENRMPFGGTRILEGSTILYRNGGMVIKIFSRDEPEFCSNEAGFLGLLQGRLPVQTPGLIGTGKYMEYPYIIMEEIPGLPLKSLWRDLSQRNRERAIEQAAEVLRCLHSIPVVEADFCTPEWNGFIASQKRNFERNHGGFGLSEERIDDIGLYLAGTAPVEETGKPVVCHTEIMREHLFGEIRGGELKLTGLLDFEPSMIGIREYDLCAVGLFLTAGENSLYRRFMDAGGYDSPPEAVMRMLLLHRYSNMKWFISTLPEKLRDAPLSRLAEYWYS